MQIVVIKRCGDKAYHRGRTKFNKKKNNWTFFRKFAKEYELDEARELLKELPLQNEYELVPVLPLIN